MNPLLSSQNLFVIKTVHPREPDKTELMIIDEFEGFFNYVENELAVTIFGQNEKSRKERAQYARELLIKMIGIDEFMRLKEFFKQSAPIESNPGLYTSLNNTERVIFKLIAKGFKQNEIAQLLEWTNSKVRHHKEQIYEKMNFAKIADLKEFAFKNKLV
ncbi:MAG: LuxR C-terminal-related transcriptional regulator [Bacteroidales bacterium]|jgi:DNA-binding NarL/FixJ family response regulator